MLLHIISRLKILANMDIATSRIPQDGRFTVKLNNKEINIRAEQESLSDERVLLEKTLNSANRLKTLIKKEIAEHEQKIKLIIPQGINPESLKGEQK